MLNNTSRWSHTPVNRVVPYHWLATRKNFIDNSSGHCCFTWVGADVFGECDQALPQCPAAAPRPGCGVDLKSCLERFSVFARQECPGDRKVAGWVTNSHTSEVDHGAQPATADKEVQRRQKRQLDG